MSLNRLAVAVAVVFTLPAGSASAEVRSGSVTDPADAFLHQNVDGTSYRDQDIQRVTASYDTAGSITTTFYFLDPVPASTPDSVEASFSTASCDYTPGRARVSLSPSSSRYDSASVYIGGYEGSIDATSTLSADHRAITVQASAPVLANRDYSCVGSIALSHEVESFHCDYTIYACFDYATVTTDETDAFRIAATSSFPIPEPEATDTGKEIDLCDSVWKALRQKQKQVKKLRAQRASARRRARKTALTRRIMTVKRSIAKTRDVLLADC